MKLETAYRKLFKHRHRWKIKIEFWQSGTVSVEMELRNEKQKPIEACFPRWDYGRGLANAMNNAAATIEDNNRIIEAYLNMKTIIAEQGQESTDAEA